MKRSYPGLDLIRFAAALMVVLYHLGFWLWRDDPGRQYPSFAFIFASGWVGVPIFFVISGFVITFSAQGRSAGEFIRSRGARLYPAAWICGTTSFLIAPNTVGNFVRTILLLPVGPWVNGVYWTLAIEIVFYGVIAIALYRGWSLARLALCLGFYSSAFWMAKAINVASGNPVDFSQIENYAGYLLLAHDGVFFAFGMLLYKRTNALAAGLFASVGLAAIAWRSHALDLSVTPFYLAPAIWLCATLLTVVLVFGNRTVSHTLRRWPMRTIGLMTYPLYLIHVDLGGVVMERFVGGYAALGAGLISVMLAALTVLPIERLIRRAVFRGVVRDAVPSLP